MIASNLKKQFLVLVLFLIVCGVYSQQPNVSEEENKAKAQELFDAENYQDAMPLYAQLVSIYSNNSEYNYKFGVCTLFGDRTDRRRPIRYLNNALRSMGNNEEINYYLGLAYYQNQEFANAMKYLNLYLAKLDPGSADRPAILEHVNACLNGMNLEHKNLISEIISKSEFQVDNFHRAYRADEFEGMLILKPENFLTAKEKNSGKNSFVYVSEPRGTIYFSGYEKGSESNKDIFKVSMDESGEWGKPEKLSDKINTMFDEEYPVLTDGGTTLYFCSKGHNSVGGYDIFKSTYNAGENSFSEPENLGLGINSPLDDILFIPDKTGDFAYFSTNRDNLNSSINVYKVRLNGESHGEEPMYAENTVKVNESNSNQSQPSSSEVKNEITKSVELAQNTEPKVAPSEKAAALRKNRDQLNLMADTAYMLISHTKSQVRSLSNKRDRANAISAKKKEEAKGMEAQLDQDLAKIHEYANEEEFEMALQKTIELKTKIVQTKKSAEHANLIAWKIGKCIKIKNTELQTLKEDAGSVQSLTVSGNFEETQIVYNKLMSRYNIADTLKDYSTDILQIAQGANTYNVPEKALAYAEDLRQGFLNNTLIASAEVKKPEIDATIPIVTIDNRTQNVAKAIPVVAAKQVEAIQFNLAENSLIFSDDEVIEINFMADAIDPYKVVEQVLFAENSTFIEIEEPGLELRFDVDMIEAFPVVEMIAFEESEMTMDEELEINIEKDIVIEPIVNQVLFAESDSDIEDPALELNFDVDMIQASPVVEMIAFEESEMTVDEELEINIEKDIIVEPIVNQVLFADSDISIEDPALELNFDIDMIEASPDAEMIAFEESEMTIDEELEINIEKEIFTEPIAETIAFNDSELNIDENLEVSFEKDVVLQTLVEPVFFAEANTDIEITDPSLELRFDTDIIVALPLVEAIAYNYSDDFTEFEEALDVSYSIDRMPTYGLIEPIRNEQYADMIETEEDLDINIENAIEDIKIAKMVNSIPLTFNEAAILVDDELEIIFSVDNVVPENNVEPIFASFEIDIFDTMDEEIEISLDAAPVETAFIYPLVQPVYNEKLTSIDINMPEDDELEISSDWDNVEAYSDIQPVQIAEYDANMGLENEIEINYHVDEADNAAHLAEIITSLKERIESQSVSSMPSIGVDLFYLREALEIVHDIETSSTDFEMLTIALTQPEDLSYEELLFAASLAQNPKDKLSIFYQAFIHIDRDWRAFNNAAISAINIQDLETAECFLYQASLISDKNGKIVNNMGILACYKNEFETAKEYFTTASIYGVNSDYNLQVVQNIYDTNSESPDHFRQELGDHKYYEVLGDASEIQND